MLLHSFIIQWQSDWIPGNNLLWAHWRTPVMMSDWYSREALSLYKCTLKVTRRQRGGQRLLSPYLCAASMHSITIQGQTDRISGEQLFGGCSSFGQDFAISGAEISSIIRMSEAGGISSLFRLPSFCPSGKWGNWSQVMKGKGRSLILLGRTKSNQ